MICVVCKREPKDIPEYVEMAQMDGYATPDDYVLENEGTYNPTKELFCCTDDYIAIGQPVRGGGWRAGNPIIRISTPIEDQTKYTTYNKEYPPYAFGPQPAPIVY